MSLKEEVYRMTQTQVFRDEENLRNLQHLRERNDDNDRKGVQESTTAELQTQFNELEARRASLKMKAANARFGKHGSEGGEAKPRVSTGRVGAPDLQASDYDEEDSNTDLSLDVPGGGGHDSDSERYGDSDNDSSFDRSGSVSEEERRTATQVNPMNVDILTSRLTKKDTKMVSNPMKNPARAKRDSHSSASSKSPKRAFLDLDDFEETPTKTSPVKENIEPQPDLSPSSTSASLFR
mmetsp:Transcript_18950/g.18276  ORF Transcript_18950/g.18276 Transcript_18950/m.18276 type:complete len:237 (+) Transcript_18950:403-1113(+)